MISPIGSNANMGSTGKICSGTELRIVDVEARRDLAEGQPGEVYIKSPANFSRYHRNGEATKHTFDGGWFKTGDVGITKKSGDLFIVDRLKVSLNRAEPLLSAPDL